MRQIKFRAWDERKKIMHHDFQYINSGTSNDVSDWVVFKSDLQPLSGKPHPFENPHFEQQLKVMQFTGLKDKNWKEIFEGDIMKTDSGANQYVAYRDDMAMFVCRFKKGASTNISSTWAVIGNIYENPELLKI